MPGVKSDLDDLFGRFDRIDLVRDQRILGFRRSYSSRVVPG
jgi:hypothetical protein